MNIKNKIRTGLREIYLSKKRKELKNKDFSLIASNCNGAVILHELGLRFNSPFVNLWIKPKDFIKMQNSLNEYMNSDLTFTTEPGIEYPVGVLKDIKIYFQHYKTENDAKAAWEERKNRINYDNLFILFTDRDGCSEDDLIAFDNLPYKNKAVFVNKEHENIKSAVYIKGFETEQSVGMCMDFRENSYKKYYDDFDYVRWFNSNC